MPRNMPLVLLVTFTLYSQSCTAADPQPNGAVAIVNISVIFEKSSAFKNRLAELKEQITATEAKLKKRKEVIDNLRKQSESLDSSDPKREKLTEEVSSQELIFNAVAGKKKQHFQKIEAKLYLTMYEQIEEEVGKYAKANAIRLVIRTSDAPSSPVSRDDVLKRLNRTVVYFEPELDITQQIQEQLETRKLALPGSEEAEAEE